MSDTDNTFEFLADYVTAKVVELLVKDRGLNIEDALLQFHNSETFEKLWEIGTGLYIESPAFVYEIFREEERRGTIRGLTE